MTGLLFLLSLIVQQPQQPVSPQAGGLGFGMIRGQLRDSKGAPAAGVRVAAAPVENGVAVTQVPTYLSNISETGSDGRFLLENVLPGRYLIVAGSLTLPSFYPEGTTPDRARIVTVVAGQALTNVDFTIPPTLALTAGACADGATGVVQIEGGDARSVAINQQVHISVNGAPATPSMLSSSCLPFNAGAFRVILRPGANTITVAQIPVGYYVKSMTAGGVDLITAPLIASGNRSAPPFELVITTRPTAGSPKAYKVSGRIVSDDYPLDPSLRMQIAGVPAMGIPDRFGPSEVVVKRLDGTFEIQGVLPGRYTLQYGGGKSTIQVEAGDITNLELKLVPRVISVNPEPPVPLNPSSISSIKGTVTVGDGTIPKFEIGFIPTREGAATLAVTVSGNDFSASLPEGEYRVRISGLPEGYTVESVTAGPLDLTEPFLAIQSGIADRLTGVPSAAGITVRLIPPSSR